MGAEFLRKLPIPKDIKEQYPLDDKLLKIKEQRDKEIADVFFGRSDKFILIIGPCSADNKKAVLDYTERLKRISLIVKDKIVIIPRIYTNKPRTIGDGYKGMLHQPVPNRQPDILKGIISVRELFLTALKDYEFTCADEMLYPDNHRYFSDLLGYVAVGARSVENQQHRLTASGLEIPVGMKNPLSGDLKVMLNAVVTANHPHNFIYRGWEVTSTGNPLVHSVLRGSSGTNEDYYQNYDCDTLLMLNELYNKSGLKYPAVIVDCNHGNSGKNPFLQYEIAMNVIKSKKSFSDLNRLVKGLMIESYIEDGAQDISEKCYGKSITDACIGWDKTEELIYGIADIL